MPDCATNPGHAEPAIAAVLPCYRTGPRVLDVIAGIGPEVAFIIVVDDACPDGCGTLVERESKDARVLVLRREANGGVGAATISGVKAALAAGASIVVKIDGDGQMDPALIPNLVGPIQRGQADFAKGNRFWDIDSLAMMPRIRLVGNAALSFIAKASSGYWQIFDPTNGFLAIHRTALERLPLDKLAHRYFFESDLLFRLYTVRAKIVEIPMTARYGDEVSNLRIPKVLLPFALGHLRNLAKRILYSYFLRDFGIASIYLVLGFPLISWGLVFGAIGWYRSYESGVTASAGTVMTAALPFLIGLQLLIGFLTIDTGNAPTEPLLRQSDHLVPHHGNRA